MKPLPEFKDNLYGEALNDDDDDDDAANEEDGEANDAALADVAFVAKDGFLLSVLPSAALLGL